MRPALRSAAHGLCLIVLAFLSACGGGEQNASGQSSGPDNSSITRLAGEVQATTWLKCANEYGICSFTGTATVRYGLNGTYATRTATTSIGCNNDVFGDPLPGADKICEYAAVAPAPAPTPEPDPLPAPAPAPSPTPGTATWIQCANEYGICSFSGTRTVRYGLNGTYALLTATGSIGCSNAVFGDPLPGANKICEYAATESEPVPAPAPTPAPDPAPVPDSATWIRCANEYGTCSFTGTRTVRYGLNGTYATRTATTSIGCNNAVFGDPLPGANKICEYASAEAEPVPPPAPTPAPDPAPGTDCNAIIDRCLDLSAPRITPYKGGRSAAASYTFDDGYVSSDKIAAIFESHGARATFFVIADAVADRTGWDLWKTLAGKGHEIGNHSKTHTIDLSDPALSDQALDTEINVARQIIQQQLGVRPVTFAFPWHAYNGKALAMANREHFSVRLRDIGEPNYAFVFFDADHTPTLAQALAEANDQLANMVNTGGWLVAGGHGVDGDGWSPVTSQFLHDHLNYARQFSARLWIDTYANVARYRLCRTQGTPVATASSSSQATVRLDGAYDASVCTAPLTVEIPMKAPFTGQLQAKNANGSPVASIISNGKVLIDLVPGETVTLEVTQ